MVISMPQASLAISMTMLDQLIEKFSYLLISNLTQTWEASKNQDSHLDMSNLSEWETLAEVHVEEPSCFPLRLKNSASIYQDTISYPVQFEQEIPLTGA